MGEIKNKWLKIIYDDGEVTLPKDIDAIIADRPSDDWVRVTMCKDCEHFTQLKHGDSLCYLDGRGCKADDYCSWAERKEDGKDVQQTEALQDVRKADRVSEAVLLLRHMPKESRCDPNAQRPQVRKRIGDRV